MQAILNLGPFLLDRTRLQPLTSAELAAARPEIDCELARLRTDIRAHYPDGLRASSIREATWLMDRLQELPLEARRYLAHHPTWV
ncbi:MAG: hypothetical protein ACAI44_25850 [Candidatus Sericytochromatia bacterium]